MGLIIGPTPWWQVNMVSLCPVGSALPDGSRIISKAGGTAWIVAPVSTQVTSAWAGGQYNTTLVGDKCCIFEWPGLNTRLIQCGFNPCDWIVPSINVLFNIGYACRTNWDSFPASPNLFWSSTEVSSTNACRLADTSCSSDIKTATQAIRAFRSVTY